MDLDPGSWGGLELGLKIGPVKTSTDLDPPVRMFKAWAPSKVLTAFRVMISWMIAH